MQRKGWAAVSTAAALALAGGYAVHHRPRPPASPPAAIAVVSAPVTVVRPTATPSASPAPVRERPERKLVETLATHDRRGGDVRMMAAVMTTQPPPPAAAAAPVEVAMTAAVARLPVFAAAAPVHVSCVRTACEVAGPLPAGQTEATMVTAFRDKQFEHDLLARGYTPGPVLVADAGDGSRGFVFYINNEF
jgi:hypothetical protein